MNKCVKVFIFVFWVILLWTLLGLNQDVLLCDSNEDISEFLADKNVENNTTYHHISYNSILFRLKRRFSWYYSGKTSGKFSSYKEFKKIWVPSNESLWNKIKTDFKADSARCTRDLNTSLNNDTRIMNDIRESRYRSYIDKLERSNIVNMTRKK